MVLDSGSAVLVTILRVIHIVAGVIWVGAGILLSMYIEPAIEKMGGDGRKFMKTLYTQTPFDKLMPIVALSTTVAGLILYYFVSGGFSPDYMRSGQGIVLSIGALFGLLAFGHGAFALGRLNGVYIAKSKEAGESPTEAQNQELLELEAKLRRHGRISMWLAVIALLGMAGARYVGPILGA